MVNMKEEKIMNTKLFNKSLIKYETRNLCGNIFSIVFGVLFPTFMTAILGPTFTKTVPDEYKAKAMTSMFISCSCMIPLATVFIGYAATFSQELEKKIPLRFKLFGFNDKILLVSKICANLIMATVSLLFYTIVCYSVLDLEKPSVTSALLLVMTLYALIIIFFVMAHGIALIFKKFSGTYTVTMLIYFGAMMVSGMFGVKVDELAKPLRYVAYLLPTTYISQDLIDFWQSGSYNFAPFVQSVIFVAVVGVLVLSYALYKNSRTANA